MAARLTVISWRDIPAQVIAKEGRRTSKQVLHLRFQVAIDRAASRAGRKDMDEYLGEWRRTERACGPDLDAEVAAEVAGIEARYTRERLAAMTAARGFDPEAVPTDEAGAATGMTPRMVDTAGAPDAVDLTPTSVAHPRDTAGPTVDGLEAVDRLEAVDGEPTEASEETWPAR